MARSLASDPAWLQAMTEQRLILEDGCSLLVQQGLVSEDCRGEVAAARNTDDAMAVAKELLTSTNAISTGLQRVYKLRENCVNSLRGWMREMEAKKALSASAPPPPKLYLRAQEFASSLSLLLLFPILEAESQKNHYLCSTTSRLVFNLLEKFEPLSLSMEPTEYLDGLEGLLLSWLGNSELSPLQDDVVLALISLCCASPCSNIVSQRILGLFLHPKHPHPLRVCSKDSSWNCDGACGFRSSKGNDMVRYRCMAGCDYDLCTPCMSPVLPRELASVACDGAFLYVTSRNGAGLSKLGCGRRGSQAARIYASTNSLAQGSVVHCNDQLLYRPDKAQPNRLCYVLHPTTLAIIAEILILEHLATEYEFFAFVGDSHHVCLVSATKTRDVDVVPVLAATYVIPRLQVAELKVVVATQSDLGVVHSTEPNGRPCLQITSCSIDQLCLGDRVLSVGGQPAADCAALEQQLQAAIGGPEVVLTVRQYFAHATLVHSSLLQLTADHSAASQPDKQMTSCGMSLQVLKGYVLAAVNGLMLTLLVKAASSTSRPSSSASDKAVVIDQLSFWLPSGSYISNSSQLLPSQLAHRQVAEQPFGSMLLSRVNDLCICVDSTNHCVWTVSDAWVDCWTTSTPIGVHSEHTERTDSVLTLGEITSKLLAFAATSAVFFAPAAPRTMLPDLQGALTTAVASRDCTRLRHALQILSFVMAGDRALLDEPLQAVRDIVVTELLPASAPPHWDGDVLRDAADLIVTNPLFFLRSTDAFVDYAVFFLDQPPELFPTTTSAFAWKLAEMAEAPELLLSIPQMATILRAHMRAVLRDSIAALEAPPTGLGTALVRALTALQSTIFARGYAMVTLLAVFEKELLTACCAYLEAVRGRMASWPLCSAAHLDAVLYPSFFVQLLPAFLVERHSSITAFPKSLVPALAAIAQQLFAIFGKVYPEGPPSMPRVALKNVVLESIHPLRDGYKYRETTSLPGSSCLYLSFDPRCSSQYDYDRVIVLAGTGPTATKVAEFGGNTAGFGSRSVFGNGWPKDPVRVVGDSVTIELEVKSSRESRTPDAAMWGFLISVRGKSEQQLPPLLDLICSVLSFSFSVVGAPDPQPGNAALFGSAVMARPFSLLPREIALCDTADTFSAPSDDVALSPEQEQLVTRCISFLRQSVQEALHLRALARIVLSALSMTGEAAGSVTSTEQQAALTALLRNVQSFANVEQKWNEETEAVAGGKDAEQAFIHDSAAASDLPLLWRVLGFAELPGGGGDRPTVIKMLHERLVQCALLFRENSPLSFSGTSVICNVIQQRAQFLTALLPRAKGHLKVSDVSSFLLDPTMVTMPELLTAARKRVLSCDDQIIALKFVQCCLAASAPAFGDLTVFVVDQAKDYLMRGLGNTSAISTTQQQELRQGYTACLQELVRLIGRDPVALSHGLSVCVAQFDPDEACCIADSQLLPLLDKLYSEPPSDAVALKAWAGFRLLATRCADWSTASMTATTTTLDFGVLPQQIATLLGNHLMEAVSSSTTSMNTVYELLCLFESLASSRLGLSVLSDSKSVTALLRLLDAGNTAPKLLFIIFRLLAVALPVVHAEAATMLSAMLSPPAVVQMLMAKLVCLRSQAELGATASAAPSGPLSPLRATSASEALALSSAAATPVTPVTSSTAAAASEASPPDPYRTPPTVPLCLEYSPAAQGRVDTQSLHPHRLVLNASHGELHWRCDVCKRVKEGPSYHCAECHYDVCLPCRVAGEQRPTDATSTDATTFVLRIHAREDQSMRDIVQVMLRIAKRAGDEGSDLESQMRLEHSDAQTIVAMRGPLGRCAVRREELASQGFNVSMDKDSGERATAGKGEDAECRARNVATSQSNAPSSFLDFTVAHKLSGSLITLVQALAAQGGAWSAAVEAAVLEGLSFVPVLASLSSDDLPSDTLLLARSALAAISIVGGYRRGVCVGDRVTLSSGVVGTVAALMPNGSQALVSLSPTTKLRLPLDDLKVPDGSGWAGLPATLHAQLCCAAVALLPRVSFAEDDSDPTLTALNRLWAELRTSACHAVTVRIRHPDTAALVAKDEALVQVLANVAVNTKVGDRETLGLCEARCLALHRLFYELKRPVLPSLARAMDTAITLYFDPQRLSYGSKGVLFTRNFSTVQQAGGRAGAPGGPRLAVAYTGKPLPSKKTVYFEFGIESVCGQSTPGPLTQFLHPLHAHPLALRPTDTPWACDGRGSNPRLGHCGRSEDRTAGLPRYGCVAGCEFSLCSDCVAKCDKENVVAIGVGPLSESKDSGDWKFPPGSTVLQATGVITSASGADVPTEVRLNPCETIGCCVDSSANTITFQTAAHNTTVPLPAASNLHVFVLLKAALSIVSLNFGQENFKLRPQSNDESPEVPPLSPVRPPTELPSKSVVDPSVPSLNASSQRYELPLASCAMDYPGFVASVEGGADEEEDSTALLVRAWETHVFPKINGRFRNSGERKTGLEQIRGALMLGMPDLARQTVEGLYEESGGIPRDLHLPSVEELKSSGAPKLGAAELERGMRVCIAAGSPSVVYEVPGMEATRGHEGTVVTVDAAKGLAQVHVYMEDQAQFMTWWYPCSVLQRAHASAEPAPGASLPDLHARLMAAEGRLASLYCRQAVVSCCEQGAAPSNLSIDQLLQLFVASTLRCAEPGHCSLTGLAPVDLFASTTGAGRFRSLANRALEQCEPEALAGLVRNVITSIGGWAETMRWTELPIETGRKTYSISQTDSFGVVLGVRAKDSRPVTRTLGSSKNGPWLSIHAALDGDEWQVGSYPATAACGGGLPFVLVPTSRVVLRTFGDDSGPNACVTAHWLPADMPCSLLTLQCLAAVPGMDAELLTEATTALLSFLAKCILAPPLRELLHHTLATLIRSSGKVGLPSVVALLHEELAATHISSILDVAQRPVSSTFFQSLVEVVTASIEVGLTPDQLRSTPSTPKAASADKPTAVSPSPTHKGAPGASQWMPKGGAGRKKVVGGKIPRKRGQPDSEPSEHPPVPTSQALEPPLFLGALTTCVEMLRYMASDRSGPMPAAMLTEARELAAPAGALKRFVVLAGIPTTLPAAAVHDLITTCGDLSDRDLLEVFLPAGPDGVSTSGNAVCVLSSSLCVATFREAVLAIRGFEQKVKAFDLDLMSVSFGPLPLLLPSLTPSADGPAPPPLVFRTIGSSHDEHVGSITEAFLRHRIQTNSAKLLQLLESLCGDSTLALLTPAATALLRCFGDVEKEQFLKKCTETESCSEASSSSAPAVADGEITVPGPRPSLPVLFAKHVFERGVAAPKDFFRALFDLGIDIDLTPSQLTPEAAAEHGASWSAAMDQQLVQHMNRYARRHQSSSAAIAPSEYALADTDLASADYVLLQGLGLPSLRMRVAVIAVLNTAVHKSIAYLDLHNLAVPSSLAALLSTARSFLLYAWKMDWMSSMLSASALRTDATGPDLILDPLETVGAAVAVPARAQVVRVAAQLDEIDPALLRVRVASGGDPIFPVVVRLSGETVQGTSGSFREFMLRMTRELLNPQLRLLVECPSAALGHNLGRFMVCPGSPSPLALKLFEFMGKLIGVALRSDVPLPLDLLPCVWKCVLGLPLDVSDVCEADLATGRLLARLEAGAVEDLVGELAGLRTLDGRAVTPAALGLSGSDMGSVAVADVDARALRQRIIDLRLGELAGASQFAALRCGLATVAPPATMTLFSWQDLELRVCGVPDIDLSFLRHHTMYQVGLSDSDAHIKFFWHALHQFSKEELRMFLKFACNQERLPGTCPCQHSGRNHTPPYPMKIAPPDGTGPPDKRYIRAETCLFMIKLPQYTTQALMTERLRYAIHCREDPLSG